MPPIRRPWLLCAVSLCVAALPAPAPATAAPGLSEARLRAAEHATLGAEHAAAHAAQRAAARRAAEAGETAPEPARMPADDALDPALHGKWAAPVPLTSIATNMALLPTGKVLIYAPPTRIGSGDFTWSKAVVWDPRTGTSKDVHPPIDPATGKPTNIWCSGISFLQDGRVLVTGGNLESGTSDWYGLDTVFTFDPWTETWEQHAPMRQGRWYPSQLTMPDGESLIIAGYVAPGDVDPAGKTNRDVELFDPHTGITRLWPGFRFGDTVPAKAPPPPRPYPHVFWTKNGALVAGPAPSDSYLLHPATGTWTDVKNPVERLFGTGVWLRDPQGRSRVWLVGGSHDPQDGTGLPAQATSQIFDPLDPAAGWIAGPSLKVARSHHNTVLLPDGSAVTLGGGVGQVPGAEFPLNEDTALHRAVELHDPVTGETRLGPSQTEGRAYHSTALLLPDGRVMSAGDDVNGPATDTQPDGRGTGVASDTAEIYSPPYLFKGPRPVIEQAPAAVRPGATFAVRTPDEIDRAVLVAPGAVTHAVDYNQRRVDLPAPEVFPGQGVNLRMPSDPVDAPPGHYMLFLLDADGVPSVATFVHLTASAPDVPRLEHPPIAPTPTPAPTPTQAAGDDAIASPTPAAAPLARRLTLTVRPLRRASPRRSGRFTVTVVLDGPGRVKVSGPLTRPVTASFGAAGRRTLTLRLTPAARSRLGRLRSLRLSGRTTHPSGAPGPPAGLTVRVR